MKITRPLHTAFTLHHSFSTIAQRYDAFILDQFGVLHDGANALDGAVECVAELKRQGKKLIILSNTSGPAATALAKLPRFGFDTNDFVDAVTSGEESSRYVQATFGNATSSITDNKNTKQQQALWFTWDGVDSPSYPQDYLDKCGNIGIASTVDEADFILTHGSDVWQKGNGLQIPLVNFKNKGDLHTTIEPILKQCLDRNLPMVCANPDFVVRMPDGSTGHMPGKIAKHYVDMGGSCKFFGKPYPEHFKACIRKLNIMDKSRVAHVGDSLHHDISGANAAGIDSVFVTSGIHCDELQTEFGILPKKELLDELLEHQQGQEYIIPTHVIAAFRF